ncbi:peptidoglycan D,D-transpeptidase FtsI family protein [Paenibacillus thermotolerans]|uniref:peptidoglycan D,D-transpeptidase FtsI family protein n=1 Tax=Paenibacillus thermotolerans TaxID=3027807 RepID=UPI00236831FE|nr:MULTISPECIES: penicillin-binding transpeptidase domain-containing protein [unclassified Paenibacillus]
MLRQIRMFIILLGMTLGIGLLGARLLWLQVKDALIPARASAGAVERAVAQRAGGVVLDSGRGRIVDRHGEAMAGIPTRSLLLLPAQAAFPSEGAIAALSRVLQIRPEELERRWRSLKAPALWSTKDGETPAELTVNQAEQIRRFALPGAIPVDTVRRYASGGVASQLIGFVAEWPERVNSHYRNKLQRGTVTLSTPIGASGLELGFDRFLQSVRPEAVVVYTDPKGNALSGLGIRKLAPNNPHYPLKLVTTIDLSVQRRLEELADRSGLNRGSIVVLDARTADVVAMVSRPQFDRSNASGQESSWRNRALIAMTPGSVYKSVIAAAALEEGVVKAGEFFDCNGSFGKYGLTCWKKGGHGHITFEEGFAQSCNIVFATVAGRLSAEALNEHAQAFGVTGTVGWSGISAVDGGPIKQFPEEEAGQAFVKGKPVNDGGVMAQTGIGQRDVLLSPLAAANWVVTLLNNGVVSTPRAVSSLRFAGGQTMEGYGLQHAAVRPVMSARTAELLRRMMRRVVEEGTGTGLQGAAWQLAGKSGTAQVTVQGKPFVHQWFVGYGPVKQPRYAVAVVAEQRPSGSSHAAIPLFKEVMDILAEAEPAMN